MRRLALSLSLLSLAAPALAATHEVQMLTRGASGAMVFEPSHLKIAPGDSVHFLASQKSHNAASIKDMMPERAKPFMGQINQEIDVTFDIPGRYGIKCSPHFAMGMVMIIDVITDGAKLRDTALPDTLPSRARERFEAILSEDHTGTQY